MPRLITQHLLGVQGDLGQVLKALPQTPTCPKLPVGLAGTREKGLQDQASSDKGRAVDKRDLCKAQETSDPQTVADCRHILDQIIPL